MQVFLCFDILCDCGLTRWPGRTDGNEASVWVMHGTFFRGQAATIPKVCRLTLLEMFKHFRCSSFLRCLSRHGLDCCMPVSRRRLSIRQWRHRFRTATSFSSELQCASICLRSRPEPNRSGNMPRGTSVYLSVECIAQENDSHAMRPECT